MHTTPPNPASQNHDHSAEPFSVPPIILIEPLSALSTTKPPLHNPSSKSDGSKPARANNDAQRRVLNSKRTKPKEAQQRVLNQKSQNAKRRTQRVLNQKSARFFLKGQSSRGAPARRFVPWRVLCRWTLPLPLPLPLPSSYRPSHGNGTEPNGKSYSVAENQILKWLYKSQM